MSSKVSSPVNGVILTDLTPTLEGFWDSPLLPLGDDFAIQVSTDQTFASVTHWNVSNLTVGWDPVAKTMTRIYAGTALSRGVTYYWRWAHSIYAWSDVGSFRINELPTVGGLSSNVLLEIGNLDEEATWDVSVNEADPIISWTYSDGDGDAQAAFQVQIGTDGSTANKHDSGEVASSDTSYTVAVGHAEDYTYYRRVRVKDSRGEWSNWSSWYTFRVDYGQAIYRYAPTGGSSSSQWSFSAAAPVANTKHAYLFASSSSTTVPTSGWKKSIGSVSPNTYLFICVRLSSHASGTQPVLTDMEFTWVASGTTPDNMELLGTTDWTFDTSVRRYGTQSLKCTQSAASSRFIIPYRINARDGIPVVPGTEYTLSAFVKTTSPLYYPIRVFVWGAGDLSWQLADGEDAPWAPEGRTYDTGSYPDGWQRIYMTFTVPDGQYLIWPGVGGSTHTDDSGANANPFWIDAIKLEEGPVATGWTPGFVAEAVVLDAGGIAVNAEAGGTFRLKSGDGELVSLGDKGLEFGTATEVYSTTSGTLGVTGDIYGTGSIRAVDEVRSGYHLQVNRAGEANVYLDHTNSPGDGTTIGRIRYRGGPSGNAYEVASILGAPDGQVPASGDSPGQLRFATTSDGSGSPVTRVQLMSDGTFRPFSNEAYSNGDATHLWQGVYSQQLSVHAKRSTDWTNRTSGTSYQVQFDGEMWDTGVDCDLSEMHNITTNNHLFSARRTGYFLVIGQVAWEANTGGGRWMEINDNVGFTIARNETRSEAGSRHGIVRAAGIWRVDSTSDYCRVDAMQNSGVALDMIAHDTWLEIHWLGAL